MALRHQRSPEESRQNAGVPSLFQIPGQGIVGFDEALQIVHAYPKPSCDPVGVPQEAGIGQDLMEEPAHEEDAMGAASQLVDGGLALAHFTPAPVKPVGVLIHAEEVSGTSNRFRLVGWPSSRELLGRLCEQHHLVESLRIGLLEYPFQVVEASYDMPLMG